MKDSRFQGTFCVWVSESFKVSGMHCIRTLRQSINRRIVQGRGIRGQKINVRDISPPYLPEGSP